MKVTIEIAADLVVEVNDCNVTQDVEMRVTTGTNYENKDPDPRKKVTFRMHKGTARALASAIMGAAAQVDG